VASRGHGGYAHRRARRQRNANGCATHDHAHPGACDGHSHARSALGYAHPRAGLGHAHGGSARRYARRNCLARDHCAGKHFLARN